MDNFLLLGLCFALGILMRRARLVPDNAAETVNAIIIWIAVPAMTLLQVHSLELSTKYLAPAFGGWIVFLGGWAVFSLMGKLLGWSRETTVCLALTGGLGNTVFLGIPLIEAYYGLEWTGPALIMDQGGNFTAMLFGMGLAAMTAGKGLPKREIVRKVITFPPTLAMIAAFLLMSVEYPVWLASTLGKIAAMLAPLAIFSVGLGVRLRAMAGRALPVSVGLAFKLVIGPLLVLAVYHGLLGRTDMLIKIATFEAAMAPMVLGGIIAMQQDLNRDLAVTMLGIGTPLSFATTAGWWWVMERFVG